MTVTDEPRTPKGSEAELVPDNVVSILERKYRAEMSGPSPNRKSGDLTYEVQNRTTAEQRRIDNQSVIQRLGLRRKKQAGPNIK